MTAPPWFPAFKIAIYSLLAANLALYVLLGRPSEIVDAAAWLVLLVLFEIETAHGGRLTARQRQIIHVLRLAAAAGVLAAAVGYLLESEWLDAANAWLWLAVVALLEVEVRAAEAVERRRETFLIAAVALYSALLMLVPVWLWRGEWLDAWDATLWLAAFFAIELNVLGYAAQS
ncbi:MAG: hypothetical protein HZC23_15085 [Rhodocyclales bacterium]|nr:hypothetical protein [Rhodocyclales bacterium]